MKIAYFDLIGGASGDMILGTLLDAGLSTDVLREDLRPLNLPDWSIETKRVTRRGISATHAILRIEDSAPERTFADLHTLVAESQLPFDTRTISTKIIRRIAAVEATIHNMPIHEVHLHELGGLDAIVDIVGAVAGLRQLGIQKVFCSSFPLARGLVQSEHGVLPLPAPATVALLQEKNSPIVGVEENFETVTPTGAAILTSLAEGFGEFPAMRLNAIGYGAGSRNDGVRPNLLRVFLGELSSDAPGINSETLAILETNIDDLNPQFYDHVMARLFDSGALDVTLLSLHMKEKSTRNAPEGTLSGREDARAPRYFIRGDHHSWRARTTRCSTFNST